MLKGKTATYLLIAAVAAVWGLIIYRIFISIGDDVPSTVSAPVGKKVPLDDYAFKQDTTKLLLNYRDPFGKSSTVSTSDTSNLKKTASKVTLTAAPLKTEITWPAISYSGYIQNPESKKLIALLHINGRNVMLAEGESIDGIKLIKNSKDAVNLQYQGKYRSFSQQNANP